MLSPLEGAGVDALHAAGLRILAQTGVRVDHPESLRVLANHGADVDRESHRVRLKPELVLEAMGRVPRCVVLHDRRGGASSLEAGGRFHVAPELSLNVRDGETGEVRPGRREDTVLAAQACDWLPHIDAVIPMVHPSDCATEVAALYEAADTLLNTSKHVMSAFPAYEDVRAFLDLCALLAPAGDLADKPIASVFLCPTSPLVLSAEAGAVLALALDRGVPVLVLSGPAVGATAPLTLAGAMAQMHAEVLFVMTLAQMRRPGAPVVYGTAPVMLDMRTGQVHYGRVENALLNAAAARLAQRLGLPCSGITAQTGGPSNSLRLGVEKFMSFVGAIGSGLSLGQGAGHAAGNAISIEQLVLDSEIAGLAKQMFRTLTVDADTLGEAAMALVGPGGSFLASRHTRRYLRSGEHYVAGLLDAEGDIHEQARAVVRSIRETHVPAIDPAGAQAVLAYVHEEVERRLRIRSETP